MGALSLVRTILLLNLTFVGAFRPHLASTTRSGSKFRAHDVKLVTSDEAQRKSTATEGHDDASVKPVLTFPGGGIFFWWQAGAISALQERYNLSSIDFVGASAGALAATVAACEADMEDAMEMALELCAANQVWSRPLGLAGVWGDMVEYWLDEVLPPNADALCRHRVHLLVLGVWPRPGRRRIISDFTSKEDLIKTCMASVHIPYFMNKRFSARYRGGRYVDGSFWAGPRALALGEERPTVYLDFMDDEVMAGRKRKLLALTNRDGLLFMRERGFEHVQGMLAQGKLDCLKGATLSSCGPAAGSASGSAALS